MEWKKLLSPGRLGCPETGEDDIKRRPEAYRDIDRITFSPAFRRLQGKTQVFPLPESDMTHTRLTHSLEVSCVGRSLGWVLSDSLEELKEYQLTIAATVSAAALAHDLGNPPFGHSGEKAIGHYFEHGDGRRFLKGMTDCNKKEFINFEGNALGFRLLVDSKPALTNNPGGLSLTNLTLATYTKYPCTIDNVLAGNVSRKKPGLFYDNVDYFKSVAEKLGITQYAQNAWHRHPLAFLVEAADDICYNIIDFEDGYKIGIVPERQITELFIKVANETSEDHKGIKQIISADQKIGYLRSKAINSLIKQVVSVFVKDQVAILSGERSRALLDDIGSKKTMREIKAISKSIVYQHQPVLEIEAAGFEILPALLEFFLGAVIGGPKTFKSKKFKSLIPPQYLPKEEGCKFPKNTQLLNICEYVASMTDEFAIDLFRKLKGISLPNSRP